MCFIVPGFSKLRYFMETGMFKSARSPPGIVLCLEFASRTKDFDENIGQKGIFVFYYCTFKNENGKLQ